MKNLISFICIAIYTLVAYYAMLFLINSFIKVDSMFTLVEVVFTSGIITIVTTLAGYFCYKIIREKDTF